MYFTAYDRTTVRPGILHFGVGNFHRAHQAVYLDQLMAAGQAQDWGICGVGVMPGDARMRDALKEQDGLYTLLLKNPDGTVDSQTVGSIVDYVYAPEDPQGLLERLASPDTRIVSLTVTEGGYNIDDATGQFKADNPAAVRDGQNPQEPQTAFGYIVEGLRHRREAGTPPFTVMSCDNLPGNGEVARRAVTGQAALSDPELAEWIEENVSFPNSMVDRITPVTTPEDVELAQSLTGTDEVWPVTCEPFMQWVLQDDFTMGRPRLEDVGVQVVEDVAPYELMKLRLLNASHQALAHWGRLLGHEFAHEAAADLDIVAFCRNYLAEEARQTLLPVAGIDVDAYIETLFERFANPAIADTLARLATDASERMPKFVLPTAWDLVSEGKAADLAAATCAAWAAGMEDSTEWEGSQVVSDRAWDDLRPFIERQRAGEEAAFLEYTPIFGDLAQNPAFVQAYLAALAQIRESDTRALLREINLGLTS